MRHTAIIVKYGALWRDGERRPRITIEALINNNESPSLRGSVIRHLVRKPLIERRGAQFPELLQKVEILDDG